MSTKNNQSGFGHIVLPLVVVALLVIGFSGYKVWHKQHAKSTNNVSTTTTATTVSIPAQIKTKADLQQAGQALNEADKQMQSQLNSSALDSSIDKLL